MKLQVILDTITVAGTQGNLDRNVERVVALEENLLAPDAVTWCSEKNAHLLKTVKDAVVICPLPDYDMEHGGKWWISPNTTLLCVENPRRAFQQVTELFDQGPPTFFQHVADEWTGRLPVAGLIGLGTVIATNTKIDDRVVIGANCTIGGVGFGYEKNENGDLELIPHLGNVVIKAGVEIGNNVCIDRAVIGSTVIGENVKIDNLVHIAHGVNVGRNSVIIAHAMIGGSATIGENCWIAPCACIRNGITIGDGATVGLAANVVKDVPPGATVVGNPARDI